MRVPTVYLYKFCVPIDNKYFINIGVVDISVRSGINYLMLQPWEIILGINPRRYILESIPKPIYIAEYYMDLEQLYQLEAIDYLYVSPHLESSSSIAKQAVINWNEAI